ncbi:hypothetical protein [Iodidimonas sp. SYSU 1G8]
MNEPVGAACPGAMRENARFVYTVPGQGKSTGPVTRRRIGVDIF